MDLGSAALYMLWGKSNHGGAPFFLGAPSTCIFCFIVKQAKLFMGILHFFSFFFFFFFLTWLTFRYVLYLLIIEHFLWVYNIHTICISNLFSYQLGVNSKATRLFNLGMSTSLGEGRL